MSNKTRTEYEHITAPYRQIELTDRFKKMFIDEKLTRSESIAVLENLKFVILLETVTEKVKARMCV